MAANEFEARGRCESLRPLVRAFLEEALDEARTRDVRAHLAECAVCLEIAAAADPSVLFLELRSGALPAPFWRGFREELHRRIETPVSGWVALFRYPRIAYVTAPLAMLLLVAASMFVLHPGRRGWDQAEGILSPYPSVGQHAAPGAAAPRFAGGSGQALPGIPVGEAAGSADRMRPVLEEVDSPAARVYHFTVGGPGDETAIYLVVDESIDI